MDPINQLAQNILTFVQTLKADAAAAKTALLTALQNFQANLVGTPDHPGFLLDALLWGCAVAGFAIGFTAVVRLFRKGGGDQSVEWASILTRFIVGSCLISLSSFKAVVDGSVFGDDLTGTGTLGISAQYQPIYDGLSNVLFLVGFFSLAKGLFLLIRISENRSGGEGMGRVFVYFISGSILMNLTKFLTLMQSAIT